jgi:hypothetical protein
MFPLRCNKYPLEHADKPAVLCCSSHRAPTEEGRNHLEHSQVILHPFPHASAAPSDNLLDDDRWILYLGTNVNRNGPQLSVVK